MRFTVFFFFSSRRRHTRLTCDWSSDVCSSDLQGLEHRSGNSDMIREPDLRSAQAFTDFGIELVVLFVVEEKRRSFRIEHFGNRANELLEQRTEFDLRRCFRNDPQHFELLLPVMLEFFSGPPALEGDRGLPDNGFEQFEISLRELALLLVQDLRSADDRALQGAEGDAENGVGDVAGLLVEVRIEALVGISVMNNDAAPACIDMSGDTQVIQHAKLAREFAGDGARAKFAGVGITQKNGRAVSVDRRCCNLSKHIEGLVQISGESDFVRYVE